MRFLTPNVVGGLALVAAILSFIAAWVKPGARGINIAIGVIFLSVAVVFRSKRR